MKKKKKKQREEQRRKETLDEMLTSVKHQLSNQLKNTTGCLHLIRVGWCVGSVRGRHTNQLVVGQKLLLRLTDDGPHISHRPVKRVSSSSSPLLGSHYVAPPGITQQMNHGAGAVKLQFTSTSNQTHSIYDLKTLCD
ncbi:unnamed protein product [Pleuronectes platessa]|uniref:Uncharacterized protein n=1 Tax=Pleuronectes platessa TaxID=8262 RepID=A0A9N7VBR2_PLEPL|nr:unnamed protein product [Pleuronectes platessa]